MKWILDIVLENNSKYKKPDLLMRELESMNKSRTLKKLYISIPQRIKQKTSLKFTDSEQFKRGL